MAIISINAATDGLIDRGGHPALAIVSRGLIHFGDMVAEIAGGAGHPVVIIYNRKNQPVQLEKNTLELLQQEVAKVNRSDSKRVTQKSINKVVKAMEWRWDAKTNMANYGISYQVALSRYQELIEELVRMMLTDEEEAILLIIANL